MAQKIKTLEITPIKDYKSKYNDREYDVKLVLSGIFNTSSVHWTYYVSANIMVRSKEMVTPDISCGFMSMTHPFDMSISSYAKKFETREEARAFINEFRVKWETGSNNTTQEIRDGKLDEILDGNT